MTQLVTDDRMVRQRQEIEEGIRQRAKLRKQPIKSPFGHAELTAPPLTDGDVLQGQSLSRPLVERRKAPRCLLQNRLCLYELILLQQGEADAIDLKCSIVELAAPLM